MLAGLRLPDPQLRVLATPPMDRQNDVAGFVVDTGDNVDDQRVHESLAGAHAHARGIPGDSKVTGEADHIRDVGAPIRRAHCVEPRFARLYTLERAFPTLPQLDGDQPVVGVAAR